MYTVVVPLTLTVLEFDLCQLTELVRQHLHLREAGSNALTDGVSCTLLSHPPGYCQDSLYLSLDGVSVDSQITQR